MLLTSLGLVWAKKEYRAFFLTMIMGSLGFSSGLPLISLYLVRDVGVGLTVAGLFSMSQALSGLITGILIGRWSDRWTSRLLAIRLAVLWNAVGWIVFALSPWHWLTLSVGGIFLGVNSVVMGQVFAALHDVMTRDGERSPGLINITVRTGWSFGFVFGPLLGTELAAQTGFHVTFMVAGILYLLCLVPLHGLVITMPRTAHSRRKEGDGRGRNLPLLAFAGVCALAFSGQSIKNTYLPIDVTTHLGGTLGIYGTIAAVTPIMELVAMPMAGMLAMRMPIGRLIVAGLITGAVEYLCLSGNSALWQLYITQVLDAWVVAVIMGLGVTYGQQLSPDRPGEVSGIIFGGTSVSAVLGNLVGGVTVPALGIPHVFLIPTGFFAVSCMMFLGIERMSRRKAVAAIVVDERRAAG